MRDTVHSLRRRGLQRVVCCLRVLAVVASTAAVGVTPGAAQPEPTIPRPRGYVSDYVGVLDPGTVRSLDTLIGELKQKTGAEIAVVIVNSTAPLEAFDYAMRIAESWKPGSAGKDNGVVFVIAIQDRKTYILTGYGVEGILPDGKVGAIRDSLILPAFRDRNYVGGITAATREMAALIAQEHGVTLTGVGKVRGQPVQQVRVSGLLVIVVVVVIALLVMTQLPPSALRGGQRGWRRSGGGFGGGGFGGGGGGFGGFGGGGFGGGGAGGSW